MSVRFCASCGHEHEAVARFCPKCGNAVTPATFVPAATIPGVSYGGFWVRVAASVIDSFATILIGLVLILLLGEGLGTLVNLVAGFLYFALMESSDKQATFGKQALGLKVTDLNGNRISFGQATGRYFAKFLSTIILGIGFLMVAFTDKKQGLHDQLASTLVVLPHSDQVLPPAIN